MPKTTIKIHDTKILQYTNTNEKFKVKYTWYVKIYKKYIYQI